MSPVTENVDIPGTPGPHYPPNMATPSNNMCSLWHAEDSIQDRVRALDVSPWIEKDIAEHDQCGCGELLDNPSLSQSRIIGQATTHAEDYDIKARLPTLVCSSKFHHVAGFATRNLRAIVFVRPDPITSLQGKDFVLAWVDSVKCHRTLWKSGIHSVHPSLDNLMVDAHKRAVLTDWDLPAAVDHLKKGVERPGTIPFMAVDLLSNTHRRGNIELRYRHDIEGFIWILVWVFLQYKDGKIVNYQLKRWQTADYITCAEQKTYFLAHLTEHFPTDSWIHEWEIAMTLLKLLRTFSTEQENEKEAIRRRRLKMFPEEFCKSIRKAVDEDLHLHYLYQIMPAGIS